MATSVQAIYTGMRVQVTSLTFNAHDKITGNSILGILSVTDLYPQTNRTVCKCSQGKALGEQREDMGTQTLSCGDVGFCPYTESLDCILGHLECEQEGGTQETTDKRQSWEYCLESELGLLRNSDRTREGEDSGKCKIHRLLLVCFSLLWQTLDRLIGGKSLLLLRGQRLPSITGKRAFSVLEFRSYNPSLGRRHGCRSGLIYGANHETERQDANVQLLFSFPCSDEFRIHTCWVGWCHPHSELCFLSHHISSKAVPH